MGALGQVGNWFLREYQTMTFGPAARFTAANGVNSSVGAVVIINCEEGGAISCNGASIMAHRSKITNPSVVCETCRTPKPPWA
jgi:hypothetical protein